MPKITKNTAATVILNTAAGGVITTDRNTVEYEAQLTALDFIELSIQQEIGGGESTKSTNISIIPDALQLDSTQTEKWVEFVDSITVARVNKVRQTTAYNNNQYDVPTLAKGDKKYLALDFENTYEHKRVREAVYIQYVDETKLTADVDTWLAANAKEIYFPKADKVVYVGKHTGYMR